MMKKTILTLVLVFLIGVVFVNAEKVDVSENIQEYIVHNYKSVNLLEKSVIFYYNPNICLDCEESKKVIKDLTDKGYSVLVTTDYFTQLSAGSLAICLNDYSTRPNIKPEEIKDYADYCRTFKVPPGGIFSIIPKKELQKTETKSTGGMKVMGVQSESAGENIIYIQQIKGNYPGFGVYLDYNNPKVQSMSPEEQVGLVNKVEAFVMDRVWDTFYKREEELGEQEFQRLNELKEKAIAEGNLDLLKDYTQLYEGEIIDEFIIRKGTPPQPVVPKEVSDFLEIGAGSPDEQVIFVRAGSAYVFADDQKPEAEPKETTLEEKPVEEQPVTGIRRITNPIKKLFTGEPEKVEETSQEQQPEQPEEKKENFVKRFFKKIFSWF